MSVDSRQLKVTPEQLLASKNRMESNINQFLSWHSKLYSEVETMRARWSGEANTRFTNQFNSFRGEFKNLENLLREYAAFLNKASTRYGTTESSLTSTAGTLPTKPM